MTSSDPAPKPAPNRNSYTRRQTYKVCTRCGVEKSCQHYALATNWRKHYLAADLKKYKTICKECTRYQSAKLIDPEFEHDTGPIRERVRKPGVVLTPDERRALRAASKREVRIVTRVKALEYLARKGCCECGERDPRVLEFDHINPKNKKNTISQLVGDGHGWGSPKLRTEIRKCRVLCSNCHRRHTLEQQGYYSDDRVVETLERLAKQHGFDK